MYLIFKINAWLDVKKSAYIINKKFKHLIWILVMFLVVVKNKMNVFNVFVRRKEHVLIRLLNCSMR